MFLLKYQLCFTITNKSLVSQKKNCSFIYSYFHSLSMYACIYMHVYICMYVCMYVCMYKGRRIYLKLWEKEKD